MTDNPVAQFEHNLRRAVGFRSSRNHFDDAIKEISAHYDDLYMEAMNRGAVRSSEPLGVDANLPPAVSS